MISATLNQWATSIGLARDTIQRALAAAGIKAEKDITAKDVFTALTGDKEAAMTRKLNAEADAKERENRLASGEIVTIEEADEVRGKIITALVQRLDSIPALIPGITLAQRTTLVGLLESIKSDAREIT